MPELPEVETTARGICSFLLDQTIATLIVRDNRLRLPVNRETNTLCAGKKITKIYRRAKYIVIKLSEGNLVIHLGMSGHLRIVSTLTEPGKHDHIDLCLSNGTILRYNDPRRFGLWLYTTGDIAQHALFKNLGPEPLSAAFSGDYLWQRAQGKTQSIKSFIMNNHVVVGVGNIYATECLFLAGIHPEFHAGKLSRQRMYMLSNAIKDILTQAILAGGTTLRDFYAADGKPGYFSFALKMYGQKGNPCSQCKIVIESVTIAGRSSTFCPQCQPRDYGQTDTLAVLSTNSI